MHQKLTLLQQLQQRSNSTDDIDFDEQDSVIVQTRTSLRKCDCCEVEEELSDEVKLRLFLARMIALKNQKTES